MHCVDWIASALAVQPAVEIPDLDNSAAHALAFAALNRCRLGNSGFGIANSICHCHPFSAKSSEALCYLVVPMIVCFLANWIYV